MNHSKTIDLNKLLANLFSLFFASLIIFSGNGIAEQRLIKVSQQGNMSIQTPAHGEKMESVKAQFGEPIKKVTEIGNPPIIRWVYNDFTVYFESDSVIHAVLKK